MTTDTARATSLSDSTLTRLFVLGSQIDTLRDVIKAVLKSGSSDYQVAGVSATELETLRTQVRAVLPADAVADMDLVVASPYPHKDGERATLSQTYLRTASLATFIDTTLNQTAWRAGYLTRDRQIAQVLPSLDGPADTSPAAPVSKVDVTVTPTATGQYM